MNNQPVPPMPQPQPANENKSQGQPPQPGQQPMPMQPGYGAPMQPMMPKKGANKGLIWGLIGGGIGLFVLVAIIIIAVVFFGGPSKADYADAARMMSEFDSKNISNSESFTKSGGGAEEYKKNVDKLLDEYDAYMEKLGKSKAMRDSEAKKMYDEISTDYKKVKPMLQELANAYVLYSGYSSSCTSKYVSYVNKSGEQVGKEFDSAMSDCFSALSKMEKSDDEVTKKFAETMTKYYKDMREYYVKTAERFSSKDYSSALPSYPKYPSVDDPLTSIADSVKDVKLTDKENKLYKYLQEKS
jgi:uncharacterized protein YfbU (UPF0304 family)